MSAPSVQELLQEASREVRSTLWDVSALDGPALAAAWPGLAAAAAAALGAVPRPDPATRLLTGRTDGPRPRPNRWGPPVDADPDPHLLRAGHALRAVADLLERYATTPRSSGAAHDADLVRRRITECLLIASHATALGLREHATRLQPARPGMAFDRPGRRLAVAGVNQAQSRRLASELDTFEAHAAHYLARVPARAPSRAPDQFVDPGSLPQALARWEVTALRVLHSQPPSVRDLAGVAHAEQALLVHAVVILSAAARAKVIDHEGFARRICPRLQDAQLAWGDVAASWPGQMTTPAPPSLAGVQASAQLHQALGQITRDGNRWATPDLIAGRVHLGQVADLLRDALMASGSRARRFAELPGELAGGGHLRAPARLLAAMQAQPAGAESEVGVRTSDVANRRVVVVRPGQITGATASARALQRQLTSLTRALETLPRPRRAAAAGEPPSGRRAGAGRVRPAHEQVSGIQPGRRATAAR